ncbi:hypothetical protein NHP21005_09150 [Helicobacter sp. NHP21005]|uniref:hypothetical protein n=1 Tax=Helicobacter felistomachi TaxID=3040201 RepID=UPI0025748855|nr:hypothetical protein [Helicobacter sp. NHP21005]BEG57227.1 hypothetical protein NHP21005_09150 [Helicobacter sp. NHP21005]
MQSQEEIADSVEVITQNTPTVPNAIVEKYVTFHNDVNSVSLGKLGTLEANLLFAIFHKLKDRQDELLENPSQKHRNPSEYALFWLFT